MRSCALAVLLLPLTISFASADEIGFATYYQNVDHPGLTAAHLTLPFGAKVRVHNLDNGRDVVVTIVDRGPHAAGRIIDVSTAAARALGMIQSGVVRVRLETITSTEVATSCAPSIPQSDSKSRQHEFLSHCSSDTSFAIAGARRGPE